MVLIAYKFCDQDQFSEEVYVIGSRCRGFNFLIYLNHLLEEATWVDQKNDFDHVNQKRLNSPERIYFSGFDQELRKADSFARNSIKFW